MKTLKDMIAEANGMVPAVEAEEAVSLAARDDILFLDVREPQERRKGTVPGSVGVPRGLLEFMADPASPLHEPKLEREKPVVIFCASGGRSALAGKTLQEMGFSDVRNLTGGFAAWQKAGGRIESET